MAEDERLKDSGQTDEWVSNLMGSLVSAIAMAVEDARQLPDWLEVSFSTGGRDVTIRVTIQETSGRQVQLLATKDYGTTHT